MTVAGSRPPLLRRVSSEEAHLARRPAVDAEILARAQAIIEEVFAGGEAALRRLARKWDGLEPRAPLRHGREELREAFQGLARKDQDVLVRAGARIEDFAKAQLATARSTGRVRVQAGWAGDRIVAVKTAGCYAPGGRYPLVSSVLMTARTARTAGVKDVWVASPSPGRRLLAAAWVAGADGLIAAGGAQAIAAMASGAVFPRCDVVVGPGNRWVTAAKLLLSGTVGIDLLAGPSELLVLADEDADPSLAAIDLLAQAEHDPQALPILVALSEEFVRKVEAEMENRLRSLKTAALTRRALEQGFAVVADEEEALACCERIGPEHLSLQGTRAGAWRDRLSVYGAAFIGAASAEVFGDYGAGPNHTLPTGGTARFASGLSVHSFLRRPTWLELEHGPDYGELVSDTRALARMEGLEAHERSAAARDPHRGKT